MYLRCMSADSDIPESRALPMADAAPIDEWEIANLDLEAYLKRLAYSGPLTPDAATLRELHRAHAAKIAFENLDVLLGRGIALDLDSVQDKLVRRARGGYCFEHNLLLAAALERLGYPVTRLAARVVLAGGVRSHMLLRVMADDRPWLADVGFGASLLEPLAFDTRSPVRQGGWTYRLDHDERRDVWLLRSKDVTGWTDLYEFTLEPQRQIDYVVYNHYTSTHPRSPFVSQVVALRTEPEIQYALRSRQLTTKRPDATTTGRDIAVEELPGVLATTFGIHLDAKETTELLRRAARPTARPT